MSATTAGVAPAHGSAGAPGPSADTVDNGPFTWQTAVLGLLVVGPLVVLAVAGALPHSAALRPTWLDAAMAIPLYLVAGFGITVGYHRCFTHGAFTATRALRIGLAVAGSLALEGSASSWVATHRRHHAHADAVGDPHSPCQFGPGVRASVKGLLWAHVGWLFARRGTNTTKFAPDLCADRDIARTDALFPLLAVVSLLLPAVLGGAVTSSWAGAVSGFLWAGLIRVFVLHHVTWSTNSICHVAGRRPFRTRDRSCNVWPLALVSLGESWHNAHHADPSSARHGVDRRQVDLSALLIRAFEAAGWASRVHWPHTARLDRLRYRHPRTRSPTG